MPSRSSFRPDHRGGRPDVDVIALAVPAEDRLLLGRVGRPDRPRCRAPDSSAPDVRAPGRIEARRSRRSPNRIRQLRHSSRIARTKAPRGRWHSARGRATRRGRGPCLARSAEHSHGLAPSRGAVRQGRHVPEGIGAAWTEESRGVVAAWCRRGHGRYAGPPSCDTRRRHRSSSGGVHAGPSPGPRPLSSHEAMR